MICSFCRDSVLESGKTWDFHHRSVDQFRVSLRESCLFCTTLAQDLQDPDLWFGRVQKNEGVYRWTLRKAPRIRESHDSIALTFRAVSEEAGRELPDRAFHLLPEEGEP